MMYICVLLLIKLSTLQSLSPPSLDKDAGAEVGYRRKSGSGDHHKEGLAKRGGSIGGSSGGANRE